VKAIVKAIRYTEYKKKEKKLKGKFPEVKLSSSDSERDSDSDWVHKNSLIEMITVDMKFLFGIL